MTPPENSISEPVLPKDCEVHSSKNDAEAMTPLTPALRGEETSWYILNHVAQGASSAEAAQRTVDRFNAANNTNLELFAPTYVVRDERGGNVRMRTAPLTFHYVFLRGAFPEIKRLCAAQNGFSFLIDRSSATQRYATISDRRMANFRTIARAYRNCLPYFSLDDVDLEDGDEVEVVRGDFPGLVGTFIPSPRSKSGSIVLNVYNKVGTIAFNVRASDVRVIRFSSRSTRANDQIDAFVPHLLAALRHYHAGEPLPTALIAKLTVFCGRMEIATVANRKLAARLSALLFATFTLLGDTTRAASARERFDTLRSAVTNPWTVALIALIFAILSPDQDACGIETSSFHQKSPIPSSVFSNRTISAADDKLASTLRDVVASLPEPSSRAQSALLAELRHYLSAE